MFIGIKGLGVVGSASGNISGPTYDSDALAYISAVESADGQALEADVKDAYNNFFVGLKDDGIFSDLSACCLLLGARTIAGALTPLVSSMPTPTNNNFVSGDYNRKTGLKGDASTKYLDANHPATADDQNNFHLSVYETQAHNLGGTFGATSGAAQLGGGFNSAAQIAYIYNSTFVHRAKDANASYTSRGTSTGFIGLNRNVPLIFTRRFNSANVNYTATSAPISAINYFVFAQNSPLSGGLHIPSNGRMPFYSFGSSTNLAQLESRVSTLVSEIGAALP